VTHCDRSLTLEDFSNGILVDTGPHGGLETAEVSGGLELDGVGLISHDLSEKLACINFVSASAPLPSCIHFSYSR